VRGKLLDWIRGWLKVRRQGVLINDKSLEWIEVVCGVPHGLAFSPLLFIIYTVLLKLS